MNILDANIPDGQRALLQGKRIRLKQIGLEIGRKNMKDEEIVPLLHRLDQPTFFTLDIDFYKQHLRHLRYCLVYLDVVETLAAEFIRRILRHRELNTKAKRMGYLVRAMRSGLTLWHIHDDAPRHLPWP